MRLSRKLGPEFARDGSVCQRQQSTEYRRPNQIFFYGRETFLIERVKIKYES